MCGFPAPAPAYSASRLSENPGLALLALVFYPGPTP
jgi:hypothetical protein